jgi:hypothetical protein
MFSSTPWPKNTFIWLVMSVKLTETDHVAKLN